MTMGLNKGRTLQFFYDLPPDGGWSQSGDQPNYGNRAADKRAAARCPGGNSGQYRSPRLFPVLSGPAPVLSPPSPAAYAGMCPARSRPEARRGAKR